MDVEHPLKPLGIEVPVIQSRKNIGIGKHNMNYIIQEMKDTLVGKKLDIFMLTPNQFLFRKSASVLNDITMNNDFAVVLQFSDDMVLHLDPRKIKLNRGGDYEMNIEGLLVVLHIHSEPEN